MSWEEYLDHDGHGDWNYYLATETFSAVKIGKVRGLHMYAGRFKQLQAMNHERLYCLAINLPRFNRGERAEHKRFAENRIRGEWFRVCPNLMRAAKFARLQNAKWVLDKYGINEWMIDENEIEAQVDHVVRLAEEALREPEQK